MNDADPEPRSSQPSADTLDVSRWVVINHLCLVEQAARIVAEMPDDLSRCQEGKVDAVRLQLKRRGPCHEMGHRE